VRSAARPPSDDAQSGETAIVQLTVLASSSSGNSSLISTASTRILVDAGLSRKDTFERLAAAGHDPERIDAIVITHEHGDHVCGLVPIARKLDCPVYLSRLTAPCIDWGEFTPKLETFQSGTCFTIGDIEVGSFTIPHDAADPVGFTFRSQGVKFAIVTDLGYLPDSVKFHLRGADLVLIESNHDLEMLKVGPYPWAVKQRVMGRKGHLSNELVSQFLKNDLDSTVSTVILGHLSEHNNHPEIVRLVGSQALERRALFTRLVVAEPGKRQEVFCY
jgi:phosphoribosyl 1,2-cyclic phosphodiesterase